MLERPVWFNERAIALIPISMIPDERMRNQLAKMRRLSLSAKMDRIHRKMTIVETRKKKVSKQPSTTETSNLDGTVDVDDRGSSNISSGASSNSEKSSVLSTASS